ncbi:MAG: hypothetical protein ACRBCI_07555 [Cellvibrionaceae bacterium]
MAGYLHYTKSPCSLVDIAKSTCVKPVDIDTYTQTLLAANHRIQTPEAKQYDHKPFILPKSVGANSIHIPHCSPQEHQTLQYLSASMGGAGVMALADLLWETKIPDYVADLNTFGGNGIGAAARGSTLILNDIARYDSLLKEYESLRNHGAVKTTLTRKEAELKRAFNHMNHRLNAKSQQLLHKHAVKTKEVVNQTGRVVRESIPLSSHADVQKLSKFAKGARVLGPGAILLDGYFRFNDVYYAYKNNNPEWKRKAVVQSVGFIAGLAAGALIGVIFAPALGGILLTMAVAGTVAVGMDYASKYIVGRAYDRFTK